MAILTASIRSNRADVVYVNQMHKQARTELNKVIVWDLLTTASIRINLRNAVANQNRMLQKSPLELKGFTNNLTKQQIYYIIYLSLISL